MAPIQRLITNTDIWCFKMRLMFSKETTATFEPRIWDSCAPWSGMRYDLIPEKE